MKIEQYDGPIVVKWYDEEACERTFVRSQWKYANNRIAIDKGFGPIFVYEGREWHWPPLYSFSYAEDVQPTICTITTPEGEELTP